MDREVERGGVGVVLRPSGGEWGWISKDFAMAFMAHISRDGLVRSQGRGVAK